ncbi:unnamed protein product [Effrenium voratum]|uniref:Apple domain-containing protein n=1 Tax=Effrenium voratum TaxID=2562239 RepID=A0AA36HJC6_9DINO|nr:unnamed protein product [Effrenium voratum]CAJ1370249.1 unnamed protein product [Effrenium voratum]|mmetsp:Transcript_50661/g.120934  ORF Transcript_50661/g.120934 Transcript_50661/m.120934 type:complete len:989 (+) Transcript_50661:49-3015(+)
MWPSNVIVLSLCGLVAAGDQCNCKSAGLKCFYDSSCPGLGCGAEGHPNCRFCGDSAGQFQACPSKKEIEAAAQATTPKPKPKLKHIEAAAHVTTPQTEHAEKRDKPKMSGDKAIKAKSSHDRCPCWHSTTLRCFYDVGCPGIGCGAHGHDNCRFCGDKAGQFPACPETEMPKPEQPKPKQSKPVKQTDAQPSLDAELGDAVLDTPMTLDVYRCMAAAAVDTHPFEDDDIADLTGALKYVHTEILTEHLQSPIRTTRKYAIDAFTVHRLRIKNPKTVLHTTKALQGEFSQFVTYDFGQATNPAQLPMLAEQGDFVGIAPCTDLHCDVRFPSQRPYSWLSLGNWCPNLTWEKKGTKQKPNPKCLKSQGQTIKGGLCPNGFNSKDFVPGSDPTGEQGCVYTYGTAKVVKLDDVVGITQEKCGKQLCKDWLDFRFNCSNDDYRRQFSLDGKIVPVKYCVEFDIHPACEANCQAEACKNVLSSSAEAYLGLPFWQGRCDARANERRAEMVGFAMGVPGALESHNLVESSALARSCPASKDTSWSCKPLLELGFAGPYCTRTFNGACDRCWIPGTQHGPPGSKPHCPLNILTSSTYTDLAIQPVCKTQAASDGCCLYTDTCEGESDPQSAKISDDGLALVAARKSTEDMEEYLKRAALQSPLFKDLPLSGENLKWAAYFTWSSAPVGMTLDQALAELKLFLESKQQMIRLITTTTTTHALSVSLTTPKPSGPACAEKSVSFAPLDMPGTTMSISSLQQCQDRCAKQKGCLHFSFLEPPAGVVKGSCHLSGFSAAPQVNSLGWISGPPTCWNEVKDKGLLIDKGHTTYVPISFACMTWGSSFSPALDGAYATLEAKDFPSEEDATLECQKRCHQRKECTHFTVQFPYRSCILAGSSANVLSGIVGAISGPARCDNRAMQSFYWEVLPESQKAFWRPTLPQAMNIALAVLAAVGLAAPFLLWRRRPSSSARGVGQVGNGEDYDVLLPHGSDSDVPA